MGEPAREPMTADEFLDWDDGTDTRHELVDGVIVATVSTTDAHGTIAGNAWGEIDRRLESHPPCRAVAGRAAPGRPQGGRRPPSRRTVRTGLGPARGGRAAPPPGCPPGAREESA